MPPHPEGPRGKGSPRPGAGTCSTALMSSRSSAGFQRPRSFVTCSGCLLFFMRLASPGAGSGLGATGADTDLDTWAGGGGDRRVCVCVRVSL